MSTQAATPTHLGRPTVGLLAVVCGAAVANIYYAQPLLPVVAQAFSVGEGQAGLLVTASQIGYALALAFLVPAGDILERRRLVSVLLLVTGVLLIGAAAAPTFGVLLAAVAIVAVTSAVAQIVVPMAASLASDENRGSVVGTVMSGLLIGILLARTVAGLVAEIGGWRLVFVLAAVVMVVLAGAVRLVLPRVPIAAEASYPSLLRSVGSIVRHDSLIRRRMVLGGVGFGCFTILWTAISFLLAAPPYSYGSGVIGLFGLAGLAGAVTAVYAGRFADQGHGRRVVTIGLALLLVSWGVLALGGTSLVALIVGIVVLDLAQQLLQISHQHAIYSRRPDARSRVTSAYLVSAFIGGAIASALTSALYAVVGWPGVCALGAVVALIGIATWALELWRPSPAEPV
ncbi:MFS transporter [Actinomycetospora endophytica]|uniref:MFS transporter n=1 Tax=Actinomycetospora endophytica TaxID=2291215 RepID=A0ABS8P833_9PSEU|nr:MFS transporter [Actinomycetospora endophytica]MCD2194406.1 MFS transporter [Actinomycetospora endophytica]